MKGRVKGARTEKAELGLHAVTSDTYEICSRTPRHSYAWSRVSVLVQQFEPSIVAKPMRCVFFGGVARGRARLRHRLVT